MEAAEPPIHKARTAKAGADEARAAETGADKGRAEKAGIGEAGAGKTRTDESWTGKSRAGESWTSESRTNEAGTRKTWASCETAARCAGKSGAAKSTGSHHGATAESTAAMPLCQRGRCGKGDRRAEHAHHQTCQKFLLHPSLHWSKPDGGIPPPCRKKKTGNTQSFQRFK
jgi:hypothetical protein